MYLKRLEIAGFKSFATRTTFEFGQGITAIVGPNGSGKSNIADALRWVLGEQSGRLLRARKLEEVVFAGSSQRSPSEKAEVTITLDNADGWLPLDFAEVSIGRRAYRSGESDYLINRKRMRLRDLHDILLQARAGQNSYAIIGQGLVETILNLRPEDRRQLIEEAADTQRYRLKIEEAQGRLAATGENVERVKLLIKEISPRLSALERQARRAAEHSQLSRELGQALQAWYAHHWHQALEGLAVARASHDQAQAEETQVRLAVDTCQRELDAIATELEQCSSSAAAAATEREHLAARGRELEQAIAIAHQRHTILEARKRDLTEELTASQEERSQAAAAAQDQQSRCQAIEQELAAGRQALAERNSELAALEEEFRGLQVSGVAAAEKAARQEATAGDLKTRSQSLARSHSDTAKDLSRLETRRRSLISQMAETVRVLRNMRAQEMEVAGSVLATAGRRDALEAQAADLRAALIALDSKQQARRGKLEALRARLQVLQEAQEHYRAAAAQEPEPEMDIEGFVAAVYQVLNVPRGLETAIEAVLADHVEGLIISHQKDAIAAAQAVAQQGLARTFVLPLDSVKGVYPLNILKERGIRGVASKLVKCEPRLQRIADALLGRVIVVEDVATALRVQRRGMGTVVTLDGVVFHPMGSISAGFPKVQQPHILGHERDLEAIPKEIERTERSLALTEREAEQLRDRLREAEAGLTNLSRDVDAVQGKRLRIQETMAGRQQRLAQLRGELRGLISARDRLSDQSRAFDRESGRLQAERERMLTEAKEGRETSHHLQRASEMIDQRRGALLQAVSEANASVARLDGETQSLAALRQASDSALTRLDSQISAKQMQLSGLEMELASLDASIDNDERELAQVRERLHSFLAAGQPDREAIAQLESRQRELQAQLLANQGRHLQAERRFLEAEAEVRRWETELATLRQRLEDDGLTVTDDGDVISLHAVAARIPHWLAAEADTDARGGDPRSAREGSEGGQGDIKPISGGAIVDPQALGQQIDRLRAQVRQLGAVNVEAQADYQQLKERHDFLSSQLADLQGAEKALRRAIDELTKVMQRRFETTFAQVAEGFSRYFEQFFGGGHAELTLGDGQNPNAAGVEIAAQPPGKRVKGLSQLSGGEKALTAVSLLFALVQTNPSPFCVLDEVDAMLDEANVGRFLDALQELSRDSQFIVVTHNRRTIEVADAIYGVSMGPDNTSRVLSLRLADVAAN